MLNENTLEDKRIADSIAALGQKTEERVSAARVSPMDPDFLLILGFAFISDAVIAILSLLDFFGLPWILRVGIGMIPLVIIGLWHLMRSGKVAKVKEEGRQRVEMFKKQADQRKELLSQQLQKTAKEGGKKVTQKTAKEGAKQIERKTAVKSAQKMALKKGYSTAGKLVTKKGALAFFGSLAPLLTIIVWFNVLWVLSTLKEK